MQKNNLKIPPVGATRCRPAIFFDRDGIVIQDVGYPHLAEHLIFVDGILSALREIKSLDCYFFLITNQSGVARGYFDIDAVHSFHKMMEEKLFAEAGWKFDGVFVCPHYQKGSVAEYAVECQCRKPRTGLVEQALSGRAVDLHASVLIGDKSSDMKCALNAGMKGIYIPSRYELDKEFADNENVHVLNNISELYSSLKFLLSVST